MLNIVQFGAADLEMNIFKHFLMKGCFCGGTFIDNSHTPIAQLARRVAFGFFPEILCGRPFFFFNFVTSLIFRTSRAFTLVL